MDNVIKSLTNGILVIDGKDVVRVFNIKMQELLGVKSKEIIGKEIQNSSLNEDFINFMTLLQNRTFNGERIIDEEYEYEISEELKMPLGISTTMLMQDNNIIGLIYVIRDKRESKELEQLKKIDKLKDEFLSMVSHELRTPLTSIKAYTETLTYMVGEGDTESELEFLKIISEESERLTRLINDIFLTAVPLFAVNPAPFTSRSLIIVTVSPAFKTTPLQSFCTTLALNSSKPLFAQFKVSSSK